MAIDDIMRITEGDQPETPDAPETPTDEPKPVPVQDPPTEPDPPPYVVRGRTTAGAFLSESQTMNDSEQARNAGALRVFLFFATATTEKQREIASKGGRAAHQKGTAHE